MSNRKKDSSAALTHNITCRVTRQAYERLSALRKQSNCRTLGELVRSILLQEKIVWYHKDASMEAVAAELAKIRAELRAVGVNVNQVTRHFNSASVPGQRTYEALKILDEYRKVSDLVDKALAVMTALADRWLQKS